MKLNTYLLMLAFFSVGIVTLLAQEKTIEGQIIDTNSLPLATVSVFIKGSTTVTMSDFDGNYSLKANQGETLVFSYFGYVTEEIVVGLETKINIILQEDATALDEVVVVAYGTTSKNAFTGSAAVVQSESLKMRTLTSPLAALEGNVSGVQFLSTSGQPGSSPEIVIRGVGTLNGSSNPLIILDGLDFQGELNQINQEDIGSITVLKDATSTALYGSRAANGVIIITTKKGKRSSGISVNVTSQFGIMNRAIGPYNSTSPSKYYEAMWEAYKNSPAGQASQNPAADASANIFSLLGRNPFNVGNDEVVGIDGKINPNASLVAEDLDWRGALERQGTRQNNAISVAGGGENSNLFLSVSDLNEKGYVIESSYERTTGRLNGVLDATDWLKFGANINFADEKETGPPSRNNEAANVFAFAKDMGAIYSPFLLNPNTGVIIRDEGGNLLWDRGEGNSVLGIQSRPTNIGRNALEEVILNNELTKRKNYGYRFKTDITIVEGLNLSLNYGKDIQTSINQSYENPVVGDGAPNGRFEETRFTRNVENANQIISYNEFFGNHNIDLILGHESFNRTYEEQRTFKESETASGIYQLDNFSVLLEGSGFREDYRLEGFFTRLNYNFNNKYYLSGSLRRDGSSIFLNNKWGTFYSLGGAWRIDQETFMNNVSFLTTLKLRASYGQVGNDFLWQDINDVNLSRDFYISRALYAILPNQGDPGIFWQSTGNANLRWESVESWDIALEFGLFNNRISGVFEFYRKNSSELLYNVPLRPSVGQSQGPDNIGNMYNQGFELSLNSRILDTNNFSWDIGLQAYTLQNKITSLPNPFVTDSRRWTAGRSRFDFYIHDFAGVDPSNGDALYYMYEEDEDGNVGIPVLNNNGTHKTINNPQEAGRGYIDSNSIPDVIGSIHNSFSYKNFNLSILLTYQMGGQLLDLGYADMMHEGIYGKSLHPDISNSWKQPGDITNVPRLQNGDQNISERLSSRWLTSSDFLALKNVNLSYSLSNKVSEKIGVNKFRLFITGENLFMWAKRKGLDPQYNLTGTPVGNDYSPNRIISLGVNLGF